MIKQNVLNKSKGLQDQSNFKTKTELATKIESTRGKAYIIENKNIALKRA